MNHYLQPIQEALGAWPYIQSAPHRFNAVEFNLHLGGRVIEIGHLHSGHLLDIPFTKKLRAALLAEGHASVHRFAPDSGWTSFTLRKPDDVGHAIWLLRLSYLQKLAAAQRSRDVSAELAQLGISPAVRAAGWPSSNEEEDTSAS